MHNVGYQIQKHRQEKVNVNMNLAKSSPLYTRVAHGHNDMRDMESGIGRNGESILQSTGRQFGAHQLPKVWYAHETSSWVLTCHPVPIRLQSAAA